MFRIIEEMDTLQGEGLHAGRPTHFIRLFGCNLQCKWCDSNYGIANPALNSYGEPIVWDAAAHAKYFMSNDHAPIVCFTGGEPLLYSASIADWITIVGQAGHHCLVEQVVIETGGGSSIAEFEKFIDVENCSIAISYCVDYKLPSAGIYSYGKMLESNYSPEFLGNGDCVKFVIADDLDLIVALRVIKEYEGMRYTNVFLSPCWDSDIAKYLRLASMVAAGIRQYNDESGWINGIGLSLQLHKLVGIK